MKTFLAAFALLMSTSAFAASMPSCHVEATLESDQGLKSVLHPEIAAKPSERQGCTTEKRHSFKIRIKQVLDGVAMGNQPCAVVGDKVDVFYDAASLPKNFRGTLSFQGDDCVGGLFLTLDKQN